jgi:hypothetical protein
VPTLLLAGELDVLTPRADAELEASRSPQAQVVVVPGVGHSTLTAANDCARAAVTRFVRGRPAAAACARRGSAPPIGLQAAYPRTLADVRRVPGLSGRGGLAVSVALATLLDTQVDLFITQAGPNAAVGGLRGGALRIRVQRARSVLTLSRLVFVPGVRVDGTIVEQSGAPSVTRLTVRGQGLVARFRIGGAGRVRGVVGGRPFSGRLPR